MTTAAAEQFNNVDPFPECTDIEIERDEETYPEHVGQLWMGSTWFNVPQARALRDWLSGALPPQADSSGGEGILGLFREMATDQGQEIERLNAEVARLRAILSTPETANFLEGVKLEAAHQRKRWGAPHDREKSAEHWYWLVGYLAGKASRAAILGDREKALHHTISSAAALAHWHQAITLDTTGCGQGVDADLQKHDTGINLLRLARERLRDVQLAPSREVAYMIAGQALMELDGP